MSVLLWGWRGAGGRAPGEGVLFFKNLIFLKKIYAHTKACLANGARKWLALFYNSRYK